MRDRAEEHCVDCGAPPPKTQTHYTLIERYGWRLSVGSGPNGRKTMDLRCPSCWADYRAQKAHSGTHEVRAASSDHPIGLKRQRHGT